MKYADLDTLRRSTDPSKGVIFEREVGRLLDGILGRKIVRSWVPDPDDGIDLMWEDEFGRVGAAQIKCYDPSHVVTSNVFDRLIADKPRQEARYKVTVDDLVLIHTSRISTRPAVRATISAHSIAIIGFEDLERVGGWFTRKKATPRPKTLRKHQRTAVKALLGPEVRSQYVAATGSGKSVTMAEVAKRFSTVVVWVPTKELIRQMAGVMAEQIPGRQIIGVYSDADLQDDEGDTIGRVAYNATALESFLTAVPNPIVISTYQSSGTVSEAVLRMGYKFDIGLFDEAHNTVMRTFRPTVGYFQMPLLDDHVPTVLRRFFTATPVVANAPVKTRMAAAGYPLFSMDDPDMYGPVVARVTLGEAISGSRATGGKALLSPFDVVAGVINDAPTLDKANARKYTSLIGKDWHNSEVASAVWLLSSMVKDDMRSMLAFTRFVKEGRGGKSARRMAELFEIVADILGYDVGVVFVSGESKVAERRAARNLLKHKPHDLNIVVNASLFGEGVDVPAIDSVAYLDPKNSIKDITQSIGRALRLDPTNPAKRAKVYLPVFADDVTEAIDTVGQTKWNPIYAIATALRDESNLVIPEVVLSLRTPPAPTPSLPTGGLPTSAVIGIVIEYDDIDVELAERMVEHTEMAGLISHGFGALPTSLTRDDYLAFGHHLSMHKGKPLSAFMTEMTNWLTKEGHL